MRLIDADAALETLAMVLPKWGFKSIDMLVVETFIKSEPTISQWIPVSERLPEDGLECEYLLTWRDRFADEPWEYNVDCCLYKAHPVKSPFVLNGRWEFHWDFYEGQECEPVAWMPLPEPYKESSNNE